jgi:hypothetical protein
MYSLSPALDWGKQDGLEGKSIFTGYDYFAGASLQEYFEGHKAGVELAQRLQGVVLGEVKRLSGGSEQPKLHRKYQEGRNMDQDLFDLRNGVTEPVVRYTDEMMAEIENERF